MGEVWEGLHTLQKTPVAVKILSHGGTRVDAYTEAFRNEVRAAAGLDHPGIVTVLDFGEIPAGTARLSGGKFVVGAPYIVMEYAYRGSLKRFEDAIGWRELKGVLVTILDALAHAHASGVVHRDMKPANILVGCGGPDDMGVKLTDFGLAHAMDHHDFARHNDSGWGTPHFMAPEQFKSAWRDYGPWTDLYALGVTAYYLCSGRYPFRPDSSGSFARSHMLETPAPLERRFDVPEEFDGWIARLLQKAPEDRFQCAADAAYALQRLVDPVAPPRQRETLTSVPVPGGRAAATLATPAASQLPHPGETGQLLAARDPVDTMMDRPETTLLVEHGTVDPRETHSFSSAAWSEDESPVRPLSHLHAAPPLPATWRRASRNSPSPKLVGAGLGLFGLRTLPMVNRDEERDFLWETLREVRDVGRARAVILRGPAGTGKSRLARWVSRRANEVGSGHQLKATFGHIAGPGDGLGRMISQHLRAGGMTFEETQERVGEVLLRWGIRGDVETDALARLLMPFGSESAGARGFEGGPDARHGLIYRYVKRLAHDRPVVIWFDDVQWGADALAFTQYVLERQHSNPAPVLFVMTVRNEALVQRAVETQLVAELATNRRFRVLDVERLTDAHTGELVRELLHLERELAREVEERSDGNPLFAVQLVGDWVATGKLVFGADGFRLRPGATADIPDDLHSIWADRLKLLMRSRPKEDLVALEAAAALGTTVDLDEWYQVCAQHGVPVPAGLLRELFEAGLATANDVGGFDFCHGLFRESLERSSRDEGRWRAINNACIRMLSGRYPRREFPYAERYASFVREAELPHLAVEPLLEAARARIDRSEFDQAVGLLETRVDIMDTLSFDASTTQRAEGWVTRAEVALWQGHYDDAERLASHAAVEARRSGWEKLLARANFVEGQANLYRGDLDRAERLFDKARERMKTNGDFVGNAECLLGLGRVAERRAQFPTARTLFEQAREEMVRAQYDLGEAQCLNALGDVARDQSDYVAARRYAEKAREIFVRLDNPIGVADCVNDLAELSRLERELEEAEILCRDALRRYEALGSDHSMHVRTNLALILAARGDYEDARSALEAVREYLERSDQAGPLGENGMLLLPLMLRLGELRRVERTFDVSAAQLERTGYRSRDARVAANECVRLLRSAGEAALAEKIGTWCERTLT